MMITQMLNNLSVSSLPMVIAALFFGLFLMGLMLWIVNKGKEKHMLSTGQTNQIDQQIDLLQDERQHLEKELSDGTLSVEGHGNACFEIDRRLLALANDVNKHSQSKQSHLTPVTILLSLLIPTFSMVIYLALGSPQSPDQPIASRSAEIIAANAGATKSQNNSALALQEAIVKTEQTPKSVEAWLLLAQAAANVSDSVTEIRALRNAIDITKSDTMIISMLAEALSRAADGQVTVPARALIKTVLESNPKEPRALFLSGLAAYQDGNNEIAINQWQTLLAVSSPNAPWVDLVQENMKRAAEAGGITLDTAKNPTPLRASGPDAEAIADAENMTKDEQNEMIASMVQRLRDRLADEPDDTDGWLRLARAYDVLGQTENTMEALAKAAKSAPNDLDIQLNFLEQILSTGSTTLNIERAKETLATAAKISPNNPQILFFKGHLARISGDKKDARDAWKALLDIMEPGSDAARALAKEIELIN